MPSKHENPLLFDGSGFPWRPIHCSLPRGFKGAINKVHIKLHRLISLVKKN